MSALKVASVQATPILLDLNASVDKACRLIEEAGKNGAKLVVLPESFLPGYPDWVWTVPAGESALLSSLYAKLVANAVDVPGPAVTKLAAAAKRAHAHVAIGVTERNHEGSGATLYNSLLYFDHNGALLGTHRKLVPTSGERTVWAQGGGETLAAYDTPFGKLGGLICWENYMPLARYAMYAWGTQVYVAPTWDYGPTWHATLRHIAKEGRVVVIGSCIAMRRKDVPDGLGLEKFYLDPAEPAGSASRQQADAADEWINPGDSMIVGPNGEILAGPSHEKEEILYAEVDLEAARGAKAMLDVAGHYARPDVFRLTVDRTPRPMID